MALVDRLVRAICSERPRKNSLFCPFLIDWCLIVNVSSHLSKLYVAFGGLIVAGFFLFSPFADIDQAKKFSPPDGILKAGFREAEWHRGKVPELRIARSRGGPRAVTFWAHVDAAGKVLEVREIITDAPFDFSFRSDEVVAAVRKITYRPFLGDGVATEAWIQDRIELGIKPSPRRTLKTAATFPKPSTPTEFSIQLSRSGCFGTCPAYSVVVHGDGKIEFHGYRYVAIPGDHQALITPEAASQLLERFRAADFFGFKDVYRAGVTDNPTYLLELVLGGKKKTVEDYVGSWVGMPDSVIELEDAVDQVAGTDRWVSTGPDTIAAMQDAGIALNSDESGEILIQAVKQGKAELVQSLLDAGAAVKSQTASGDRRSLFNVASFIRDRESQIQVLRVLVGNSAARTDKEGMQEALGHVVEKGNVEAAKILIAAGADPTQLFFDTYKNEGKPDQTYLMRAAASGVWEMIDDALSRAHDIHAVDSNGRSALSHVLWSAPPMEDIFPLIDRLLAAGASKDELTRTLADGCDSRQWRAGLITRGANQAVCSDHGK